MPFDAIQLGIPSICLGPSICAPICSHSLDDLLNLKWVDEKERHQWACNMAYCQWTGDELKSGEAWAHLKREIEYQIKHPKSYTEKKLVGGKNKRAE